MVKKISVLVGIFGFLMTYASTLYAVDANAVLGVWLTDKKPKATQITIAKCGNKYCGTITWLEDLEALDSNNPDESKIKNKMLGLQMVWGFEFDDDEWEDGNIYDPRSGKTYDCEMWFEDDNLDELQVKGKILFIGKTTTWFRKK